MSKPENPMDASGDPRTTQLHLRIEEAVPRGSGAAARILHGIAKELALVKVISWRQEVKHRWELGRPVYDEDGHIIEIERDESCIALMDDYGHPEGFADSAVEVVKPFLIEIDWSYDLLGADAATSIAIQAWAGMNPLPSSRSPARRRLSAKRRDAILDRLKGLPVHTEEKGPTYREIADAILQEGVRGPVTTRDDRMSDLIVAALKATRSMK